MVAATKTGKSCMPFEMKVYTPDNDRHYTSNAVQVGDRRPTQTRNPMHRAHIKLAEQARATAPNMKMLIHPMVGMAELDDMDHHTCAEYVSEQDSAQRVSLSPCAWAACATPSGTATSARSTA